MSSKQRTIVKTYKGKQEDAMAAFKADSANKAAKGYFPTSQSWAPGSYGCGAFIVALLLCFIIIGILAFIYMLIVKPDGVLSVTYELRGAPESSAQIKHGEGKICPMCAERVKVAAKVCRYCGHRF